MLSVVIMSAIILRVISPSCVMINLVILSVIMLRAFLVKIAKLNLIALYCFMLTKCCFAECCYAECHYAECSYNECIMLGVIFPSGIIIHLVNLSVIMLRAVLPGIAKLNNTILLCNN
jgi:hypothetical protein